MFKTTALIAMTILSSSVFSCPDLTGEYRCTDPTFSQHWKQHDEGGIDLSERIKLKVTNNLEVVSLQFLQESKYHHGDDITTNTYNSGEVYRSAPWGEPQTEVYECDETGYSTIIDGVEVGHAIFKIVPTEKGFNRITTNRSTLRNLPEGHKVDQICIKQ
jgi:hypothetical protein